jgi:hypothetical protein
VVVTVTTGIFADSVVNSGMHCQAGSLRECLQRSFCHDVQPSCFQHDVSRSFSKRTYCSSVQAAAEDAAHSVLSCRRPRPSTCAIAAVSDTMSSTDCLERATAAVRLIVSFNALKLFTQRMASSSSPGTNAPVPPQKTPELRAPAKEEMLTQPAGVSVALRSPAESFVAAGRVASGLFERMRGVASGRHSTARVLRSGHSPIVLEKAHIAGQLLEVRRQTEAEVSTAFGVRAHSLPVAKLTNFDLAPALH